MYKVNESDEGGGGLSYNDNFNVFEEITKPTELFR